MKASTETWTVTFAQMLDNGYSNVTEQAQGTYAGTTSEFYTGVKPGDAVTVARTTYFWPDGAVSSVSYSVSKGGAWLAVYPNADGAYPFTT